MQDFTGWIPIRLYWQEDAMLVDWGWLGDLRFTDPFFEQTVNQSLSHPANLLFRRQTSLETLTEWASTSPGLRPTGFIFHMSRCGSTLISQMLSRLHRNLVISEAPPVDHLLRAHFRHAALTQQEQAIWLRGLVSALGQRRQPQQEHFFIKFDCWHTVFLPVILRAFPGVPWLFVYREPVEVLMSQRAQRGAQMIPGVLEPRLFGWDLAMVKRMQLEEYGARVLAKICEAAANHVGEQGGKLLNYAQLPAIVCPTLTEFWGVNCSQADADQMIDAARWHAKNPVSLFDKEAAVNNRGVSDEIRRLAQEWLAGPYQRLEIQRQQSGFSQVTGATPV